MYVFSLYCLSMYYCIVHSSVCIVLYDVLSIVLYVCMYSLYHYVYCIILVVMAINFEGSVISSTKISLSWDVPTIPGDQVIITYFRIDILEVETGRRLSIVTSSTSTDITSLHPYFTYHSDLYTVSGNTTYSTDNTVILRTYQSGT